MRVQTETAPLSAGDASGPESHNVRASGLRITTVGTLSTGQNGFNPSPAVQGSSSVFINGVPVVRQGDSYAPHSNPSGVTIVETAVGGAANVNVG